MTQGEFDSKVRSLLLRIGRKRAASKRNIPLADKIALLTEEKALRHELHELRLHYFELVEDSPLVHQQVAQFLLGDTK